MGGSVAVHVAANKALPSLAGLVVVDVVEGTAMASLIHMQKILSNRMQYFSTIEKAAGVKATSLRSVVPRHTIPFNSQTGFQEHVKVHF
ncbi:unnamed protein product [Ilex paraguariensis]|uniref:Protein phosphatase methylesterase-1 n=1 Tax=Ilex paraguariensis TaxID=185542 RepID=A0ABC8RCX9_9AQUA